MRINNAISFAVICPVYNSEKYIAQTLESVLQQTLLPKEIIIVDDGSNDGTLEIIHEVEHKWNVTISIIKSSHKGPGAARNLGVIRSNSDWIAFIDSDDLWKKNKLETISKSIVSHPLKNIFCHAEDHLNLNGSIKSINYGKSYDYSKKLSSQLFLRNYFSTSAVVCKKELILKFGGFDENMMNAQDYDLWLKISPDCSPLFLSNILGVYRIRNGSITSGSINNKTINLLKIFMRYKSYVTIRQLFLKMMRIIASYFKSF